MSSCGDPVGIQYGSPAPVSAGEPEERCPSDGDLPGPLPEGRLLAPDDPGLGPGEQRGRPAGHIAVLGGSGYGQYRARPRWRRRFGRRTRG